MNQRLRMEVEGMVQGIGFRPYVYHLARRLGLVGSIRNSEAGVSIEVQGAAETVACFLATLPLEAPPLAQLFKIDTADLALGEDADFLILESTRSDPASTLISPDIATCDACVQEMLDPANRRYRYPFINCTNCGPRFTIVRSVPYDRSQTSMAEFTMCALCQAEYNDPLDRRFHAQPIACWACGPQVQLVDRDGIKQEGEPIAGAMRHLQQGSIVAIKGLGGFHLAVDPFQLNAVRALRQRKGRAEKPFGMMVADIAAAKALCALSEREAELLMSPQHPIVLLQRLSTDQDWVVPDGKELGIFLPYTPVHHLLFESGGLTALVMTSGNLSDEPIAIDNGEAMVRLGGIADFFLVHDREILLRCDDSVVRQAGEATQFVRRSRGYVPSPIPLRDTIPSILAVGGELKSAICLSRGRYAYLGQHIGDINTLSAHGFFQESIRHFEQILEVRPAVIACDLHPGYLATRWAKSQPAAPVVCVQHHHAHIASCMADNLLTGEVIGVALDGTGYGSDGCVWGGEVLVASLQQCTRAAHLAYRRMPGGEKAVHEPWRMAVSHLFDTFGEEWRRYAPPALLKHVQSSHILLVEQLLRSGQHAPFTSSCGRLFDAVAALVCDRTTATYEAQAAIALEACCDTRTDMGTYPFALINNDCMQIDTKPLFQALTKDLGEGVAAGTMSRRFHAGLINILAETVFRVAQSHSLDRVCLSGGSFHNRILSQGLRHKIEAAGLLAFTHRQVPPGDGGLSLGQLVVAASQTL